MVRIYFLITGITLCASLLNFFAQAFLAFRFGVGSSADAYAFALSIPMFVSGLVAAVISYTVVPLIAAECPHPNNQVQLGNAMIRRALIGAALFSSVGVPAMWLQPALLQHAGRFSTDQMLPTLIMSAWCVAGVQIATAVAVAYLNATSRPLVAAVVALPTSIGTILALALIWQQGIASAMLGSLAGAIFALMVGIYGMGLKPWQSLETATMVRPPNANLISSTWAMLALSCFSSFVVIDAIWAPTLGEGALASLGYVQRVVIGVGSLAVVGPSALFVPRFASLLSSCDLVGFRRTATQGLGGMAIISIACATVMFLFADQIVTLLFQRGAFDSAASALVSNLLRNMAPGVAGMLVSVIAMRGLFCFPEAARGTAFLGLGWTLGYFSLSYLFLGLGVVGIARAYSICWIGLSILCTFYVFYLVRLREKATLGLQKW